MSTSIILSSNSTNFTTTIEDPIILSRDKDYEAALTALYTYNSFPNITNENNKLAYSTNKGEHWKDIELSTGAYELSEINNEIQRQMILNDDYDKEYNRFYVNFSVNKPTLKSILEINNENYMVNFSIENSLASTLGFENKIYSSGIYESPYVIDIEKVNAVLIHCDFITGSSINGINSQVIHSFSPHVSPGYKIIEMPKPQLFFHPVIKQPQIDRIKIWLTDQNNKIVDLRGEKITLHIMLRKTDDTEKSIQEVKNSIEKYFKN